MHLAKLANDSDVKTLLEKIGVDRGGEKILSSKMSMLYFYIADLHVAAANILKQDALSIGADVAVPKGVITCEHERVDVLLFGTLKHISRLSRKELSQPFGLKNVAKELQKIIKPQKIYEPKIMGVINVNSDSFYKGSRFMKDNALNRVEQMIEEGARIIDIGAVSSRPGSKPVHASEELARIKPIVEAVYREKLYEKVRFSIDSYSPEVISYALSHGFTIVNDITGLENDAVCELVAQYEASAIIMHMQGTPQVMQSDPHYDDVLKEVGDFLEARLEKAEKFGISDIVLDVGVGFGKRLEDNLMLIKNLENFKKFGVELLVGASRKSLIGEISGDKVEDRLAGTIALHLEALNRGATILRVHDVKEHMQMLKVVEVLKSV